MREGNRRLFNNYQMPKLVPLTFLIVVQFLDHMMTPLKFLSAGSLTGSFQIARELVVDVTNTPAELLHLDCHGWLGSIFNGCGIKVGTSQRNFVFKSLNP